MCDGDPALKARHFRIQRTEPHGDLANLNCHIGVTSESNPLTEMSMGSG
jgi:hypothetical protein